MPYGVFHRCTLTLVRQKETLTMARLVQFQDDYSGKIVDAEQINADFKFSVGDNRWVIDATDDTVAAMLNALEPFISKARIVMTGKQPVKAVSVTAPTANGGTLPKQPPSNDEIREWAHTQPKWRDKINDHGRIPRELKEEYLAVHA